MKKYRDIIVYVILGVMTTAVNYAVYLPCYNLFSLSAAVSNMLGWIGAVLFAYATNKPLVFHSKDWSIQTIIPEFTKFVGCRIGSGFLETAILFVFVDCLHFNGNIIKLAVSIIVVVLNYLSSKLIVFKKKK